MRAGVLAWVGMAALAAAGLAGFIRERAWAEGAIAVGSTGNVVRDGIAFGMAVDMPKDAAGEAAVKRCRTFEARAAADRCQVVATFSGECFAIAYDLKPGTPGAGWGVGPDQLAANQKAVAMCEQAAGPARKGYCQVERFGCDTGPRIEPKAGAEGQPEAAPEAKPEPKPDAKPAMPGTDAKAAPDAKDKKGANEEAKTETEAKPLSKITVDGAPPEAPKQADTAKADKAATAESSEDGPAPPESDPSPVPQTKPKAVAPPADPRPRNLGSPLLPALAMGGVGLAYVAGQHLRGRLKGGFAEGQILTGSALAIAAAIAVKLIDMAGGGGTLAAALAGLIALGAALLV